MEHLCVVTTSLPNAPYEARNMSSHRIPSERIDDGLHAFSFEGITHAASAWLLSPLTSEAGSRLWMMSTLSTSTDTGPSSLSLVDHVCQRIELEDEECLKIGFKRKLNVLLQSVSAA
ncbi:hypothetical protein R1flu_002608 [Riccia fluitans]|uniref:SAM domain-containing protein n=1 Tax=Riccia fluitans TaxID=41844 RepID=A0ABD1Y6K7_9MARC